MLVEPILYTNLYGEKLLLSTGDIVSPVIRDDWKFISPTLGPPTDTINEVNHLKTSNNINNNTYFIIHTDSFGLPQLRNLILKNYKEINKKGLIIYLTEILTKYQGQPISVDRRHTKLADEFDFKKFRFDFNKKIDIGCVQFDDIDCFIKNNKLTNVKVYIIEKDYKDVFKKYKTFEIVYHDTYLTDYLCRQPNLVSSSASNKLKYKFLCTNYRYASHRHLMAAYLITKNSKISWAYEGSVENLQNLLIFDLASTSKLNDIVQGIDILNKKIPLSLDMNYNRVKTSGKLSDQLFLYPTDQELKRVDKTIYQDTFCSIICESEFFEITSNISEKTTNAIYNKRPFVVMGSPNTLRLIKDLGFKTFDTFWSEDYDTFYDSKVRFEKVCDTIDFINDFSLDKCADLLVQMNEILEYNYNKLHELTNGVCINDSV